MNHRTKEKIERLVSIIEDYIDVKAISKTDFNQGKDFKVVMTHLRKKRRYD